MSVVITQFNFACLITIYIFFLTSVKFLNVSCFGVLGDGSCFSFNSQPSRQRWSSIGGSLCSDSLFQPTSFLTSAAFTAMPFIQSFIWIDFKIKALGHNSTGEEIKDTSRYKAILIGTVINIIRSKSNWKSWNKMRDCPDLKACLSMVHSWRRQCAW